MIDKSLKRKILSKEELTCREISTYFNPYSDLPLTGLFKKFRQEQKDKKRRKQEERGFSYDLDEPDDKRTIKRI